MLRRKALDLQHDEARAAMAEIAPRRGSIDAVGTKRSCESFREANGLTFMAIAEGKQLNYRSRLAATRNDFCEPLEDY